MYRRMGVSQGRLCFVELAQDDPYLLSMFVLTDDGSGWKLEGQLECSQIWASTGARNVMPRAFGVIGPLSASVTLILGGKHSLSIEMGTEAATVLGISEIDEVEAAGPGEFCLTVFLKACVLPPWLEASRIPSVS
ncbi:hypothetical protein PR202_ga05420 [Eleusine coracana subsp. coracana]|uniref:Uncharacterized protein n=1 Tax=Eleusine coracana subsp. coracana TaxID=191504 RepID=A0AAV5BS58_ELECO|nr:hypothetical protein PR202_ga04967 [Eleusine coracana subsp. coracana]GJM89249.1 hypothetical protein PR202_ga05420 [Eleusine coracana subsp. coracana]